MKLSIDRKLLADALASLSRVVERRNTIPILSNVKIEATDCLVLTGTDMDIEITVKLPADIEVTGAVTVSAALITGITKRMTTNEGGSIQLEVDTEARNLLVSARKAVFTAPVLPAVEFPVMLPPTEDDAKFKVDAATFAEILSRNAYAMSNEETRYFLCGVYFEIGQKTEGEIVTVATNGLTLGTSRSLLPDLTDIKTPGIIIPSKTVQHITKLCTDAVGDIDVTVSSQKISVSSNDVYLVSKLVDGDFPDYERVIPNSSKTTMKVDVAAWREAAARLELIDSNGPACAAIHLTDGLITIGTQSGGGEAYIEEMDDEYQGDDVSIGLNVKLLLDTLEACQSETATLEFGGSGQAVKLTPNDGRDALSVIMPRRIMTP